MTPCPRRSSIRVLFYCSPAFRPGDEIKTGNSEGFGAIVHTSRWKRFLNKECETFVPNHAGLYNHTNRQTHSGQPNTKTLQHKQSSNYHSRPLREARTINSAVGQCSPAQWNPRKESVELANFWFACSRFYLAVPSGLRVHFFLAASDAAAAPAAVTNSGFSELKFAIDFTIGAGCSWYVCIVTATKKKYRNFYDCDSCLSVVGGIAIVSCSGHEGAYVIRPP